MELGFGLHGDRALHPTVRSDCDSHPDDGEPFDQNVFISATGATHRLDGRFRVLIDENVLIAGALDRAGYERGVPCGGPLGDCQLDRHLTRREVRRQRVERQTREDLGRRDRSRGEQLCLWACAEGGEVAFFVVWACPAGLDLREGGPGERRGFCPAFVFQEGLEEFCLGGQLNRNSGIVMSR